MDNFLKQVIRSHYARKHEDDPFISFDDCLHAGPSTPVRIISRLVAGGIAATVLAGLIFIYQSGHSGDAGRPDSLANIDVELSSQTSRPEGISGALLDELQTGFQNSAVLGLTEYQSGLLAAIMQNYFASTRPDVKNNLARVKTDILSAAMNNPEIALDGMQARAMAGMMGKWQPRIENGVIIDYAWMGDKELERYLADCSTYCHQGTGADQLEHYLTGCIVNKYRGSCTLLPGEGDVVVSGGSDGLQIQ